MGLCSSLDFNEMGPAQPPSSEEEGAANQTLPLKERLHLLPSPSPGKVSVAPTKECSFCL